MPFRLFAALWISRFLVAAQDVATSTIKTAPNGPQLLQKQFGLSGPFRSRIYYRFFRLANPAANFSANTIWNIVFRNADMSFAAVAIEQSPM